MSRENHESGPEWSFVRSLCTQLIDQLPATARHLTDGIRSALPAYAVVPRHTHTAHVAEQLRIRLTALAEHRELSAAELAKASDLAAQRASQGVPIDAVIAAYQAGDQEIWNLIAEQATTAADVVLPELGRLMFVATSRTTEAMARAHSRVARELDAGRITLAHQFVQLLEDPETHPEATLVAAKLGFDPSGTFVACDWRPPEHSSPDVTYESVTALASAQITVVARAAGDGRFELLAQPPDPESWTRLAEQELTDGRLGIGMARRGIAGAHASLTDAHLALGSTTGVDTAARFADTWLEALVIAGSDRLHDLLEPAVKASRAHPHLAETVRSFASADMSIAKTAKSVHLHANTVTYRLDRWADLTGMNPRTVRGLSHSLIACQLGERSS
ncbi:helix-turn-helix domain-containing protein [uncultured Mycolicibacterium sp.]|uniref:PucR family transcriptional regulator n=1 Tax=uncultured Mycolicibacterium sp. TaxID=2320817 RepID=UPI0032B24433